MKNKVKSSKEANVAIKKEYNNLVALQKIYGSTIFVAKEYKNCSITEVSKAEWFDNLTQVLKIYKVSRKGKLKLIYKETAFGMEVKKCQ